METDWPGLIAFIILKGEGEGQVWTGSNQPPKKWAQFNQAWLRLNPALAKPCCYIEPYLNLIRAQSGKWIQFCFSTRFLFEHVSICLLFFLEIHFIPMDTI